MTTDSNSGLTPKCPECGAPLGDPDGCDACPWRAPHATGAKTAADAPNGDDDDQVTETAGRSLSGTGRPAWHVCTESRDVCTDGGKPRLMIPEDPCPGCGRPTVAVLGFVTREPCRTAGGRDTSDDTFSKRGATVPADPEHDVCLPILEAGDGRMEYPRCPDCGGEIVWAEADSVAGSRACIGDADDRSESRRWRDYIETAAANGEPPPALPGRPGCGSTFADSTYHAAARSHQCRLHPEGIR